MSLELWLVGLALALGLVACGYDGCASHRPQSRSTALLPLVPYTETRQETSEIDFGTPLGDAYLLAGWASQPPEGVEPIAGTVTYLRRSLGRLLFHVAEVGERTVELRCATLPGRRPRVTVDARVNGSPIGRYVFTREMSSASWSVPARLLRPGRNELGVQAGTAVGPQGLRTSRNPRRSPPIACDLLRIDGGSSESPLAQLESRENGAIAAAMAPGSALEWFVHIGTRPRLFVRGRGGDIRVAVVRADGTETAAREGSAEPTGTRIPLPGEPGDVERLRITSENSVHLDVVSLEQEDAGMTPRHVDATPATGVILYVVDTLRADRLSCYGYERPTSPHIDALAAQSVLFADAQSQAPWTRPAVASILTGVTPMRHGAVRLHSAISTTQPTLAEVLQSEGYATAAFVTNMNVSPLWGFDRGFDKYAYFEEHPDTRRSYEPAATIHTAALQWLDEVGERPFLLYLHASDLHAPYTPSEAYAEQFERRDLRPEHANARRIMQAFQHSGETPPPETAAWLSSLYDAEIAEFDAALGRFLDELRDRGILDRALLVFVADHGEEFGDHGGLSHGRTLHGELLHIPLLLHLPDQRWAGTSVASIAQSIDLMPTILDVLGRPVPPGLDGRSLLPLCDGSPGDGERLALSHTWLGRRELAAVTAPGWKAVLDETRGRTRRKQDLEQVYDRRADPGENADVSGAQPLLVGLARQTITASAAGARVAPPETAPMSPKVIERMRQLGYDVGRQR